MWHTIYTHVIQGNFELLMVGNQIGTLTPGLFSIITCVISTQMGHAIH
jgi:hypothetical protein